MEINDLSKAMRDALRSSPELVTALQRQGTLVQALAKYQEEYNKKAKESINYSQDTVKLLEKMEDTVGDAAGRYQEFASKVGDSAELMRLNNSIANNLVEAVQEQVGLTVIQKTGLEGIYAQTLAQKLIEAGITDEKKIQKELESGKHDDTIKHLRTEQEALKVVKKKNDLTKQLADTTLEIREEAEKYKKGLEKALATARAIGNDPKVFGAYMLTQMVEHLGHINHQMHELVETGMQAGEAIKIMREDFGVMSVLGLTKVDEVSKSLVANFGTANALTSEQRDAVGEMAYNYGLAGDEATNLMMAISRMPGESKDSAINFKQTADNIGKMKGVLPSQIMKEVAKNTQLMATFSKGGVEGFAKAAAEAKRLGIELSSVGSAAERLLDFESSITSQMEASVLIGKELNFDRMREAALAGDLNTVMEEQARIMKEVGSMDSMNTLQKKALADAMGLTTEELEKMSEAQKFNNQYFGENSTVLDNVIGKTLKYGGAVAGFAKEHGMMILTLVQGITQLLTYTAIKKLSTASTIQDTAAEVSNGAAKRLNATQMQVYNAMRAQGIAASTAYAAAKNLETGSETLNTAGKQRGIIATIASKAATLAMNAVTLTRNIVLGAGNLILAAGAGLMSLFGINTATAGAAGATASGGFLALGTSLGAFGAAAAPAIPIILAIGLALLAASPAIRVIGEVIKSLAQVIGNVLMKALEMLPSIVQSVANGFTQIISTLSMDNIGPLLLLGPAFLGMAAGLSALAIVGAVTLPILLPLVGAVTMLGVVAPQLAKGMSLLVGSLKDVPFENLLALPFAFTGIAAGLTAMTIAGYAALPILGALTMLGVVAPALSGLGEAIGGLLGGGGEDDKMSELLTEIRGLRSDINKGGVINMDGQKVGEVVALALNTTGG